MRGRMRLHMTSWVTRSYRYVVATFSVMNGRVPTPVVGP